MSTPHTQISVSSHVKLVLDYCRRADESYNDLLERILTDTAGDRIDGLDRTLEAQSDPVSLHRKRAKIRRNGWTRRLPSDSTDTDN